MNQPENDNKPTDQLHSSDLGETQDFNELRFNEEKNTFEVDVQGEEKDYDHPFPYETPSDNGADFNSDFDEANPFVGDEYAAGDKDLDGKLDDVGMHVDQGESVVLSPEDELLTRTEEDERDDLDEEGYPVNDRPGV